MKDYTTYPNRLRTLQKLEETLQRGEKLLHQYKELWEEHLEIGDCISLNVIAAKMETNKEVTAAIKKIIRDIKLELSN
jgi:t-SNARE complex subunit (syntaxin)